MSPRPANIHLGPGLSHREGAIDAIYRFVEALDRADADLLRSAFANDGVIDLSGLTPCTGKPYDEKKGVEAIVNSVLAHVGPMDSSHHLSNFRVKMNSDQSQAEVTCYALAQHFKSGEGHDPSKRDYVIMGNTYWADVAKGSDEEDALWRIKKIEVTNVWSEGDLAAIE